MERRLRIAAWVAREILPHEASVRSWLGRACSSSQDIDEVVQEAYCRLAMLQTVEHIDRPNAYFFSICRNLLVRRLKRERVVPITAIAEMESVCVDASPSPERETAGRLDYARLLAMLDTLPPRCREIVRLRKLEGWSQKDIAAHFNTTQKAVEKQVWLGVKAIREAWKNAEEQAQQRLLALGSKGGRP